MKTSEKIEVILRGEFTNMDINIEGLHVPLYRSGQGEYVKSYEYFEIQWPLDVNIRLKSGLGKRWEVIIRLGGKSIFRRNGMFLEKRWITLSGSFQKEGIHEPAHDETRAGYTILSCI
jgi:hypothetical protein